MTEDGASADGPRESEPCSGAESEPEAELSAEDLRARVEDCLQYRFSNPELLERALTHASAASQARRSNERLEFLGDAVVGLVISDYVYQTTPELAEGEMTIIKSAAVSRRTMARVGRALGLPGFLHVDQGLRRRKTYPQSIVANVYEALVGAMYLDGGLDAAAQFILRTLELHVSRVRTSRLAASGKSTLQERVQAEGQPVPRYEILRYEGPEHDRRFFAAVYVSGQERGTGAGATKKDAEQRAAREALRKLYPGEYD